jgi:hypothetical protein
MSDRLAGVNENKKTQRTLTDTVSISLLVKLIVPFALEGGAASKRRKPPNRRINIINQQLRPTASSYTPTMAPCIFFRTASSPPPCPT